MKQRIAINLTVPSGGYSLNIQSVHQCHDKLIVVAEGKSYDGFSIASVCHLEDAVTVKTTADQALPVVYYLLAKNQKLALAFSQYGIMNAEYAPEEPTVFIPIDHINKIEFPLEEQSCLYRPRQDGMTALRLDRLENERELPGLVLERSPTAIVNVYAVLDEDLINIGLETIVELAYENKFKKLSHINLNQHEAFFKNNLWMTTDNRLVFDALSDNQQKTFVTEALEFSLPKDNIEIVLDFMSKLDSVVCSLQDPYEETYTYNAIQVSAQSILSCYDDLLISNVGNKGFKIQDEKLISLEDFMKKPHTRKNPYSVGKTLLNGIMQNEALKEHYPDLIYFLNKFFKNCQLTLITDPLTVFDRVMNVNSKSLEKELPQETMLKIIGDIEKTILNEKPTPLLFFMTHLDRLAKKRLISPALGQIADDQKPYNFNYTEFSVLSAATFTMRSDGRISFLMKENAGYLRYYSEGKPNHGILEREFRHLAKVLGLEFANNINFHEEIIFTSESTLKLKAMGLHLKDFNVNRQPQNNIHSFFKLFYNTIARESANTPSQRLST